MKVGFVCTSCNVFSWGLITGISKCNGSMSIQLNVNKVLSFRINAGKREFLHLQMSKASHFPQQKSCAASIQCCYFHLKVSFVRLCAGWFHFHGDRAEMQTGHRLDSHRHSHALAYQHMLSAWLRTFPLAVLMFRASFSHRDLWPCNTTQCWDFRPCAARQNKLISLFFV